MRVALLEDDKNQGDILVQWMQDSGHQCDWFENGDSLLQARASAPFDLYLLDWMTPGKSGLEVLQQISGEEAGRVPVIFVSQRDAESDVVQALNAGADDYLVKPLRRAELMSRIEAVSRRVRPGHMPEAVLTEGVYEFRVSSREAYLRGSMVRLTDKEFDIAVFLFRNVGKLLSRKQLLEALWGHLGDVQTRTLDTHMSRIRRKLDLRPANGFRLNSIYNFGYRFDRSQRGSDD